MAKGRARKAVFSASAARKTAQYKPGGKSRYARKRAYCRKHGVWGFDVPEPKPWKV